MITDITSKVTTLKEIADKMGLSCKAAKKWILTFTDIEFPKNKKRKKYFTSGETKKIIEEFEK